MRRTRRGSLPLRAGIRLAASVQLAARPARQLGPVAICVGLLLCTPGLAAADPDGSSEAMAGLIADVANADQRLHELRAEIEAEQESVNKALVDLETARDDAATAQHNVDVSRQAVNDANTAITAAQQRFDTFAAATYVNGPSGSYLTTKGPDDVITTAAAGQTLAVTSQRVLDNLQRARTEQVNKESAARLAKQRADKAASDAQSRQQAAVSALTNAHNTFAEQQQQVDRSAAARDAARARLDAARAWAVRTGGRSAGPRAASPTGDRWDPDAQSAAPPTRDPRQWDGEWDPTLPMVPSANVPGDPIAVINTVLGISATSSQVTANMGRKFLQSVGLIKPDAPDPGITNGRIPRVYGRQASEYVIRRGMSQIGVPYSWGGGNAAGPSTGIGSGSGTTGFDCSGLVLYSFAGVGIKLPHYSGSQYNLGRKIPSSQMRRGDVIFYGPGGSQHVTIYLGNGQMLEAPDVGQTVKVSPVRTSGMTPYVVRYIEY
jgi:cell wall-associated NlpC family hydrolase